MAADTARIGLSCQLRRTTSNRQLPLAISQTLSPPTAGTHSPSGGLSRWKNRGEPHDARDLLHLASASRYRVLATFVRVCELVVLTVISPRAISLTSPSAAVPCSGCFLGCTSAGATPTGGGPSLLGSALAGCTRCRCPPATHPPPPSSVPCCTVLSSHVLSLPQIVSPSLLLAQPFPSSLHIVVPTRAISWRWRKLLPPAVTSHVFFRGLPQESPLLVSLLS